MSYSLYISPQEYNIALENGIGKVTLEYRIHNLLWDKQKAISTPPKEQKPIKQLKIIAEKNGISYPVLQKRLHVYGWDAERAVLEPLQDRHRNMEVVRGKRGVENLK